MATDVAGRDVAVGPEDLLGVRSRISWGPILAGAFLALGLYFLLTFLGGMIGWSVSDNVRSDTLGTMAAVWTIAVTVVCMFIGGYIASQFTAGENTFEGTVYGLLV